MEALIFCILLSSTLATSYDVFPSVSSSLIPELCYNYTQFMDIKLCDKSVTKQLPRGSRFAITDCVAFVTPYEDSTSHLCPFIIPIVTELDNKCHTFFYSNNSIFTLNLVTTTPPTQFPDTTNHVFSPYLDDTLRVFCPLYGFPPPSYTWSVPIRGDAYSDLNYSSLYAIKTRNNPVSDEISQLYIEAGCPTSVSFLYNPWFDGTFLCTGTNYLGSKTVAVITVNNRNQCINGDNDRFRNSSDRVFSLASDYKISPADIGTDITINCTFNPFSGDIFLFWIKTENLNKVNNFCVNKTDPYILTSDSKYTTSSVSVWTGDLNCTIRISLTIHGFQMADEGSYSCTSLLCNGPYSEMSNREILLAGDRDTQTPSSWLFALVTPPLVLIIVSLVVSSVLVYVYKVRLIRWYIAWRVEEPVGHFEFDLCICTAEEYKQVFVDEVSSGLFDMFEDEKVLWSEKDQSILAGRSHFVNASEILEKCRKFIFVVDERFVDCFFCKQLMEMAVEKSSVKNWNIILPVKWNQQAIVPNELLVYRYVEKEGNENFEEEVGNFMIGRNLALRNERSIHGTEMDNLNIPLV